MRISIEDLLARLRANGLGFDEKKVKRAWEFAGLAHHGQKRKSGEDFAYHPLQVGIYLAEWKLDETTVIAGLLHDTVEDGGATKDDIVKEFGSDVWRLVDGVTKVLDIKLGASRQETYVENLRKMILVMTKDLRVVLIRLADRLHNMETLWALSIEKQVAKSQETLEIYAPLAERLGIGEIKTRLEDLAFPYVYPDEYKRVVKESKKYYAEADRVIKQMRRKILLRMAKEGYKVRIHSRKKGLYSLWRKLERPETSGDYSKINDIVAMRIITGDIHSCYVALGVVHEIYKPVPSIGISDFIAQPKPNGYRSIHTKVFGPRSRIVEIQIRSEEMHEQAEYGVAAHFAYAEAKTKSKTGEVNVRGDKLSWVKELVGWQQEVADSQEFLRAVKFDAFHSRIFVFSPKGDVYDLPEGATPVDFAAAVHTKLLFYIKAAKVDGKIVPLDYKLKSGQVVEIEKTKEPRKVSRDWMDFVVTQTARKEVRKNLG